MTPLMISQLVIALGPPALTLIKDLSVVWGSTKALTPEEVNRICDNAQKSYDSYIADAKATLLGPTV